MCAEEVCFQSSASYNSNRKKQAETEENVCGKVLRLFGSILNYS